MLERLKLAFVLLAVNCSLLACSAKEIILGNDAFMRCWQGVKISEASYRIRFDALVYPREGVISSSRSCRDLRMSLEFRHPPMPPEFDAFERARSNRFDLVGIRGIALVDVARRERADLMVVNVRRLIAGEVLSPDETARLHSIMTATATPPSTSRTSWLPNSNSEAWPPARSALVTRHAKEMWRPR